MVGWTSPTHIVLLLLIALLLFGAKRLPEIGRSLGHGMREFKDSVSGSGEHDAHASQPVLPPADEQATVLGAERLPEIGRSLGQGVRELKESISDSGEHERHAPQAELPPADERTAVQTSVREREIV